MYLLVQIALNVLSCTERQFEMFIQFLICLVERIWYPPYFLIIWNYYIFMQSSICQLKREPFRATHLKAWVWRQDATFPFRIEMCFYDTGHHIIW